MVNFVRINGRHALRGDVLPDYAAELVALPIITYMSSYYGRMPRSGPSAVRINELHYVLSRECCRTHERLTTSDFPRHFSHTPPRELYPIEFIDNAIIPSYRGHPIPTDITSSPCDVRSRRFFHPGAAS